MSFHEFAEVACPRTLSGAFFFGSSICFKLILPEKNYAGKYVENWCPFLKKIFDYASDMKHFQRAYLRPFPRLDVYGFRIYSSKHST